MAGDSWSIEIASAVFAIDGEELVLGRDPEADVVVDDSQVSWRHAGLRVEHGELVVRDLGSSNGTYLDEQVVAGAGTRISRPAALRVGRTRAAITRNGASAPAPVPTPAPPTPAPDGRIALSGQITVGRAPDNDVVLDEPNISWHHARIDASGTPKVVDLRSRNGVRLDDQFVQGSATLGAGSRIGIGRFTLRREGDFLVASDDRGNLRLRAESVAVEAGGKTILNPTSIGVASGEMLGVIGPSGSGKSTLIKCLAGIIHPTSGAVKVDDESIALRMTDVGYVPQHESVHGLLKLREALEYSADLRLPSDTGSAERAAVVDGTIADLKLCGHEETLVERLSGGQRKRVACGVELIGDPEILILDEPTSGLDPSLEHQMMATLRDLADSGRGVVVVTHATSSLEMCSTVAVMGRGGDLLFCGPPDQALTHFAVKTFDEIYGRLDLIDADRTPLPVGQLTSERRPRGHVLSGRPLFWQLATLLSRGAKTLTRERRTLLIQLLQAPIIGICIALLHRDENLFADGGPATKASQYVFMLVTAAVWLGLIGACREIVKERSIVLRELSVGVRMDAYIFSKAALLFTQSAIQVVLMLVPALALQNVGTTGAGGQIALLAILVLCAWAATSIGLLVSTLARSVDQATSFIPLLLIPMLLFGGALVPQHSMSPAVRPVSDATVSRWGFSGAGSVAGLQDVMLDEQHRLASFGKKMDHAAGDAREQSDFFSQPVWVAAVVLSGMTALLLLLTALVLFRRVSRPQGDQT